MLTLANLIVHLLEGVAVAAAVFLVTHKTLAVKDFAILVLTITATFIVLDLFAPKVGVGARQGSGFGLGFAQVAGDGSYPAQYFVESMDGEEVEEEEVEEEEVESIDDEE